MFGFGGFGGRPMPAGGGGLGGQLAGVGQSMARTPQGFGGGGGRRGGFSPMQQFGGMMPGRAGQFGRAAGAMGAPGAGMSPTMAAGMAALSDEESKTKIRELENELSRTYAALSGPSATADVQPTAPDTDALDAAYRKPSSNSYEYKDPTIPGAAPGRQAGPMADELKGLPGVVAPGADGLDRVDTSRLTMTNASEIGNLRREMDALLGKTARGDANPDGTY